MPLLLFDSDAFCKLGIAGLLEEIPPTFGIAANDAGCLPALPHMLRRGKLRKTFGDADCDKLIPAAEQLAVDLSPSAAWLDKLTVWIGSISVRRSSSQRSRNMEACL